ncbi:MAG: sterol desaturase family protein [Rhodobacteraceae bacterium]|nr:sterol desaturase family protein [Paracoccaceae bacterium]
MAAWEFRFPWRPLVQSRILRWSGNIGVVVVATLMGRVLMPIMPVAAASVASERGWGMFNVIGWDGFWAGLAGFVLLDLVIYVQHRAFHAVPVLWRLHRMHHADTEIDATTGLRFHPIEIVLSLTVKVGAVFAFGISPVAVLLFEVVLNATALFNHGNVKIADRIDRLLRLFIVTPDMHRVHHSVAPEETDSNFGFNLPWWDRLFGTYVAQPAGGLANMTIGLSAFRDAREQRLDRLLAQPFVPERK